VGGEIGPFQLAILLTVLCMVPIFFWRENYGSNDSEGGQNSASNSNNVENSLSMTVSLVASVKLIYQHPAVFCLGLSQACFEGAVYTFGKQSPLFTMFCLQWQWFLLFSHNFVCAFFSLAVISQCLCGFHRCWF
jgi:hypothetical protein